MVGFQMSQSEWLDFERDAPIDMEAAPVTMLESIMELAME